MPQNSPSNSPSTSFVRVSNPGIRAFANAKSWEHVAHQLSKWESLNYLGLFYLDFFLDSNTQPMRIRSQQHCAAKRELLHSTPVFKIFWTEPITLNRLQCHNPVPRHQKFKMYITVIQSNWLHHPVSIIDLTNPVLGPFCTTSWSQEEIWILSLEKNVFWNYVSFCFSLKHHMQQNMECNQCY